MKGNDEEKLKSLATRLMQQDEARLRALMPKVEAALNMEGS